MKYKNALGLSTYREGGRAINRAINNTYHGGNIETDHHVIYSMREDVSKNLVLPNSTTTIPGTLRGVLDNDIELRDKMSLNGLEIIQFSTTETQYHRKT